MDKNKNKDTYKIVEEVREVLDVLNSNPRKIEMTKEEREEIMSLLKNLKTYNDEPTKANKNKEKEKKKPHLTNNGFQKIKDTSKKEEDNIPEVGIKFPHEVFGEYGQRLYDYCEETCKIQEFTFAAFLTTLSSVIGNRAQIKIFDDFYENAMIFCAILARSGNSKSPSIKPFKKIIDEIDNYYQDIYEEEKKIYDSFKEYIGTKRGDNRAEAIAEFLQENGLSEPPKKPISNSHKSRDITYSKLVRKCRDNENGYIIVTDEFDTFLKNLKKGSYYGSEGDWNELFDGGSLVKETSGGETDQDKHIRASNPFVSILGATQIGLIDSLLNDKSTITGFAMRFLYAISDKTVDLNSIYRRKRFLSDPNLLEEIKNYLLEIFHTPLSRYDNGRVKKQTFTYTEDAMKVFDDYSLEAFDIKSNNATYESKLNIYIHRFALILQIWDNITQGNTMFANKVVDADVAKRAAKLADYYYHIFRIIQNKSEELPLINMKDNEREFYEKLPKDPFNLKYACGLGEKHNFSSSKIQRLLNKWSKPDGLLKSEGSQKHRTYTKLY